ncbi:hypothetical protein A3B42_00680 [Candidatus Daviesbacteria bacterium RIFCSPLOWO2_01_FULL_38_10]|nr:MAG: hypothetical protein US80_C0005G0047 [Candidatus Daviesbacteria bacterium GW2011_GWA2_38_17]OGE29310.1 MAG: hypothetical protein A2772_00060 [Candidatus Daviesbacteria bacterium RIFCSPHIGHO2_01_FULL_38_8b]OGE40230.1 MAG: hypothetical protein A3B42_00680 [Candidatus Daviesbacteria bacterium RIFCSPLOWO2_01_FULL_38_10]OGE45211.1 MAG: hypothetical protein A3E67_01695 [Candidatus Daviesbacteria bacterium RIFCSPHIGHO2_12_FULL_38_25]OGE68635.1 MAG: hypothetical protein A3H81_03345 [Candidatus 
MKKNDLNQIKGLSIQELLIKIKLLRKEIEDAILDKNMKKLKDLKTVFKKKKDLARMLTIVKQRELLEALEPKEQK